VRWAVLPLCFASGLAGLTYEVVWHRLLAVVLGNASFATAAVLAAVMGGMGVGALIAGRYADRVDPLRLYALLEIGLGAIALSVPWLATSAQGWSLPLLRAVGPGWGSFVVRFGVATTVVLLPALLLGATLPALVRAVELRASSAPDRVGRAASAVYALNTAGAALGCAITGYVLLGAWGVRATNQLAAGVDLGVGAVALGLSFVAVRGGASGPAKAVLPKTEARPFAKRRVLGLAFVAGLVVLGLETIWTRLFLLVFGHDVHAFSAMLASVLVGLAIGSAIYRGLPTRLRTHDALVPTLFGALGAVALMSLALVGRRYLSVGLDVLGVDATLSLTRSHERGIVLQGIFAATTILPTAVIAGAIFPALVSRYPGSGTGDRTGRVLAANTAGTLTGPLVTPLVLVPLIGIGGASLLLAFVATTASVLVTPRAQSRWAAVALVGLSLAWLAVPSELPRQILARKIGPAHVSLIVYEEGRSATVAVAENQINGERQIFVNGINEVTTRLVHDQSFMLLGHLGLLLHPEPREVAVICLGGGLAAGAVARHDVERITIVDLEPAVEHAARAFSDLNHGVLDDPRVSLVIDDGRAHLRTADTRYDVIVVDSTHPRAVDSWILYTRELYRTTRERLADDGVLVQWLPLHGLSADEFRILVGTFVETFPEATLWTNVGFEPYGQTAYSLLVASRDGAPIDPERIAERLEEPRVAAALEPWGLDTAGEVLECLHAGPDTLRRWTAGLPINTDDHPRVQFVTPYTRGAAMTPDRLLEAFAPASAPIDPPPGPALAAELASRWEAQGLLLSGALDRAAAVCAECAKLPMFEAEMREGRAYYTELGRRYAGDAERILEVAAGLLLHGEHDAAESLLSDAADVDPDPNVLLHLGLVRASASDHDAAIEAFRRALSIDPDRALVRANLGRSLNERGRGDEAIVQLERAVADDPSLADAHAALAHALMQHQRQGDLPERALESALELDPRHRDAHILLGRLYLRQRRDDDAADALTRALGYHPYDEDILFNLALAEERRGDPARARAYLERVLVVDPTDGEALDALSALGPTG